ncbi:MAG TPA: STAS domain-containing protein [Pyrinomonadaceae bacterium]|nr:STAS domain-containing protein [Pyrinomonadaceae bacterium]
MPTNIIQTVSEADGSVTLRVEGDMLLEDALLLEKIAMGMRGDNFRDVVIDLADLDFLDSESAPVLKRLAKELNFRIEGIEIFLQAAINSAERSSPS